MIPSALLAAWMFLVSGAHVTALLRQRRHARRTPPTAAQTPSATLLRPLAGAEPGLAARLEDTAHLEPVVFCVESTSDSAHAAATAAVASLSARGVRASVVLTGAEGPNHKVDQLARALARSDDASELLVVCDSDVTLEGIDLRPALAAFADPALGVLWFAPVPGHTCLSLGDRAMAAVLAGSLHAFPLLAHIDRGGLVGKAMVVRRQALHDAGGFESLRHHLGEDFELGLRIRQSGARVELASRVVATAARGVTVSAAVERFARWIAVVKSQRTALLGSYPLLFGVTTPALALAAALHVAWLWIPAFALLSTRTWVWWAARRSAGHRLGLGMLAVDLVLSDLLLWTAWLRVLVARPLHWRGRSITFGPERRLQGRAREPAQHPLGHGAPP